VIILKDIFVVRLVTRFFMGFCPMTDIIVSLGQPVIFYDHFYDFGLYTQIAELIAVRTRTGVHCRSPVKIFQANFEGYVAKVGEGLVMKIGDLDWNPSKQNNLKGSWKWCVDRDGYKVWERK